MRVLVAEDDPDIQIILKMVLTRLGKCDVFITDQGKELLAQVVSQPPAFILLDMMLPDMSGMDICTALKADEKTSKIPVIFLTARTQPSEIQEGLQKGAIGYLTKPFDPMNLIGQINDLLGP